MKRTFSAALGSIRQAVTSYTFSISAFALMLVLLLASTDSFVKAFRETTSLAYGIHGEIIHEALRSDAMLFFAPILSALPFSSQYVEDLKTRYARYLLCRSSFGAYLTGKLVGCMVSGALVLVLGVLLAYGGAALLLMPLEKALEAGEKAPQWLATAFSDCGPIALCGALWAVTGMALSTLMESRYIAYASPFILSYVLLMLHDRYFPDLYVISPREWLIPSEVWFYGRGSAILQVAELLVIMAVLFAYRAGRRLREG